jgi:hypothetical protein
VDAFQRLFMGLQCCVFSDASSVMRCIDMLIKALLSDLITLGSVGMNVLNVLCVWEIFVFHMS